MFLRSLLTLVVLALAEPAIAEEVRISVTDANGKPVRDAVVTLAVSGTTMGSAAGRAQFSWPMQVDQRDMQFDPFVLIAPAGATVAFPNFDSERHHVFSFSPSGPFELRLYGKDETKSVSFPNAGVIAVGCNIHDNMSAYVYVVDTPFAAKTGDDGVAVIANPPSGRAVLAVWHPFMRAKDNTEMREVDLTGSDRTQAFQVRLRPEPLHRHSY